MRFTLLLASGALAASLVLSACSGGSMPVPTAGSQSMLPMGIPDEFATLRLEGNQPDTSCPSSAGSTYVDCYDLKPGTTTKFEWCVVKKGKTSCKKKDLEPGTWTWKKYKVYKAGTTKKVSTITSKWSPNPGNPTDNIIKVAKSVKSTHGAVGYYTDVKACNTKNKCVGPAEIGIVIK